MKKGDYDAVYGCWISSIFGIFQLLDPITQKRVVAQQFFFAQSSKSCQQCFGTKIIIYLFFLLPIRKFCPMAKMAATQNFYPIFFF